MLTQQYRLHRAQDITRVYRQGRYGGVGNVSVKVRPNHLPASRAVVVVGRKTDKRAVGRNRLRRRVAAGLARLWDRLPAGYDMVVTVHQDLNELSTEQIDAKLLQALGGAGVR